jgi:hypothetical protein
VQLTKLSDDLETNAANLKIKTDELEKLLGHSKNDTDYIRELQLKIGNVCAVFNDRFPATMIPFAKNYN